MDLQLAFLMTRTVERLLIVAIGGASLWMGWQLFLRLQLEAQQGEISYGNISVKIQRVAPGIFFAAFGAVLLGIAIYNIPSLSIDTQNVVNIRMADTGNAVDRQIRALNVSQAIGDVPDTDLITEDLRDALRNHISDIVNIRDRLLNDKFGRKTLDLWKQNRDALRKGLKPLPDTEMENIKEVDDLVSSLK